MENSMQYPYPLVDFDQGTPPFAYQYDIFSPQELDSLQNIAINSNSDALVGGRDGGRLDDNVRRTKLSWVSPDNESEWIFNRLSQAVSQINSQYYQFDLRHFAEALQFTNYVAEDAGKYSWHQDFGSTVSRKLSVVVQLTDPSQYEGGNLQLLTSSEPINIEKRRGMVVFFPSWTLHQVTPVTAGTRQSLVSWVTGPRFK